MTGSDGMEASVSDDTTTPTANLAALCECGHGRAYHGDTDCGALVGDAVYCTCGGFVSPTTCSCGHRADQHEAGSTQCLAGCACVEYNPDGRVGWPFDVVKTGEPEPDSGDLVERVAAHMYRAQFVPGDVIVAWPHVPDGVRDRYRWFACGTVATVAAECTPEPVLLDAPAVAHHAHLTDWVDDGSRSGRWLAWCDCGWSGNLETNPLVAVSGYSQHVASDGGGES